MPIFLTALVMSASVLLFWPTIASLAAEWSLGTYRHGWLVALICIVLLVRAMREIGSARLRPDLLAGAALCAASLVWCVLFKANIQGGHQTLWPLIAFLAVAALAGRGIARACLFPIAFFYFAVPVWDVLKRPLQLLGAAVSGVMLKASGIPAFISGDFIQVAAGDFEVADGCSGLNFLIVALALSTLYGELLRGNWRSRLKLTALATALALAGNWIRIYVIVVIGVESDMKSSLIDAHASFGWWIFAGVLVVFFLIASRMRIGHAEPRRVEEVSHARATPIAAAVLGIVGLVAGPVVLSIAPEPDAGTIAIDLPRNPGDFAGPLTRSNDWNPQYRGAQVSAAGLYRATDGVVELYVARYGVQREGAELAASDNSILGGLERFQIAARNTLTTPAPLNEFVLEEGSQESWIVWYGYSVGDRKFVSPYAEALWYGVASLHAKPVASVVAARARCEKDCAGARALLERFWRTGWGT